MTANVTFAASRALKLSNQPDHSEATVEKNIGLHKSKNSQEEKQATDFDLLDQSSKKYDVNVGTGTSKDVVSSDVKLFLNRSEINRDERSISKTSPSGLSETNGKAVKEGIGCVFIDENMVAQEMPFKRGGGPLPKIKKKMSNT